MISALLVGAFCSSPAPVLAQPGFAVMDANDVTLWVAPQGWMSEAIWGDAGEHHLFDAGLWVGHDQQVMGWADWDVSVDWREAAPRWETTDASGKRVRLFYDDAGAANRIGLSVQQTVQQWSAPERSDFLIIEYRVTNTGGEALSGVYVGVYMDPDITAETAIDDDLVDYDAESGVLYGFDGAPDPRPGHLGLALLAAPGGSEPLTATSWIVGLGDPETDADQYALMTSGVVIDAPGEPGDQRFQLTAQPFDLGVNESKAVDFGLVMGSSIEELRTSTAEMRAAYAAEPVAVEPAGDGVPGGYALLQNYPNPFNPTTSIAYDLPEAAEVSLTVTDLLGRRVGVLEAGLKQAGRHAVRFDASGLPSGVYLYRLEAGAFVETKRLVVLK